MKVPLAVLDAVFPLAIVNVAIWEIESSSTMFLVVDPTSFVNRPVWEEHFSKAMSLVAAPVSFVIRLNVVAELSLAPFAYHWFLRIVEDAISIFHIVTPLAVVNCSVLFGLWI